MRLCCEWHLPHQLTCVTAAQSGFELVGLENDGLRGVDYPGMGLLGVFLTPAMDIFHRSRCATAAFLERLSATNPRLLAVTPRTRRQQSTSCQHKVTLSGETLCIEQDLAEALGWTPEHTTDGLSLPLSSWGPNYFAMTQKGTDAGRVACTWPWVTARVLWRETLPDLVARSTIESSRHPIVQGVLEHLKRTDSE